MSFFDDVGNKVGGYIDTRAKALDTPTTRGAVVGGMIGGPFGAIAGGVLGSKFGGKGGDGQPAGPIEPRPELSPWVGMNQADVRGTDLFRPQTVSGRQIAAEMEQSPWYRMAQQRQAAEEARALDLAAKGQAGATAGARSQLAMRGGLRGGAAERLAGAGASNLAEMMQQQRAQGAIERGQIGMQATDLASKLAQQQVQTMNEAQAKNVQAGLGELAQKRAYDIARYQEQMKGYAAERTGEALGKEPKPTLWGNPVEYIGGLFK